MDADTKLISYFKDFKEISESPEFNNLDKGAAFIYETNPDGTLKKDDKNNPIKMLDENGNPKREGISLQQELLRIQKGLFELQVKIIFSKLKKITTECNNLSPVNVTKLFTVIREKVEFMNQYIEEKEKEYEQIDPSGVDTGTKIINNDITTPIKSVEPVNIQNPVVNIPKSENIPDPQSVQDSIDAINEKDRIKLMENDRDTLAKLIAIGGFAYITMEESKKEEEFNKLKDTHGALFDRNNITNWNEFMGSAEAIDKELKKPSQPNSSSSSSQPNSSSSSSQPRNYDSRGVEIRTPMKSSEDIIKIQQNRRHPPNNNSQQDINNQVSLNRDEVTEDFKEMFDNYFTQILRDIIPGFKTAFSLEGTHMLGKYRDTIFNKIDEDIKTNSESVQIQKYKLYLNLLIDHHISVYGDIYKVPITVLRDDIDDVILNELFLLL